MGALDNLPVELEGDTFPLSEVADISKKDPKRLIVDCSSFPQAASTIVKAIVNSGLNLNPQQDGLRIYVPIPKVTKEHREKLAKGVKAKCMECQNALKKRQNALVSELSDTKKGTKDQVLALKQIVQAICQHFGREADQMMVAKQKEVLGK